MINKSFLVTMVVVAAAVSAGLAWRADMVRIDFDKDSSGALPTGWKAEGTKPDGPVATWQVTTDSGAPSQPNALAITKINHSSSSTYNVCWTDAVKFEDGTIELSFRADSGENDQGGGPMWRVKDANNYYICRANPLEGNFRLYYVKDGARKQLATAEADIASGKWHTIKVEHRGETIACSLNGTKLLEAKDATLTGAGGIGLWTKADAVTAFDNIKINTGPAGDKKDEPKKDAGKSGG